MIIDSFGPYECRHATRVDVPAMTRFFEKLVCGIKNKDMYEMEQRKLQMVLSYVIDSADAIVVTKKGKLVASYTGENNEIMYIGNKGDLTTLAIMLKTGLCDLQNAFKEATFTVTNDIHRGLYESIGSKYGKVTSIDENGKGYVSVKGKQAIKDAYNLLRSKYD